MLLVASDTITTASYCAPGWRYDGVGPYPADYVQDVDLKCYRTRKFISCVEVFTVRLETGYTSQQVELLHFTPLFGGYNHGDCYHNSIHSLSTSPFTVELSPTTSEGGPAPCGTVAFKILYVVAYVLKQHMTEYKWVILYIHVSVGTVYQCRGSACVLSLSNHHYHHDRRKNGYCKLVKIS